MIADPTTIPETQNDVDEYKAAMDAAVGQSDLATAAPLARSLSEASVASDAVRGHAYEVLGQALEADGSVDDAIDAYRRANVFGNTQAAAAAERLLAGEDTGGIEAARTPENEAEADKYYLAAKRALDGGDSERAHDLFLAIYNSGINNAGQTGQAAYMLGLSCKESGSHDAAYQYFRQASELAVPSIVALAHERLAEYNTGDGTTSAGQDHASSEQLDSAEAATTMLQAAVDRYDNNDMPGAESRFTAVHASSAASNEQKGYAAYYLAVLAWQANNPDVARTLFREAKASADSTTASQAAQMLQSHWGES